MTDHVRETTEQTIDVEIPDQTTTTEVEVETPDGGNVAVEVETGPAEE